MMKHKILLIIFITFILTFTSGCWDKIETSDRGFMAAIVFDLNEEALKQKEQEKGSNAFYEDRPKILKVSFGMVNPSKLLSGDKAFVSRTVAGANLADAISALAASSSRRPFFGHAILVVFTEKFAKNQMVFRDALDEFERNPAMNRQMKAVLYRGESTDVFKIEPKLENLIAGYVAGIMNNSQVLDGTVDMDMGGFTTNLRNGEGRGVLPVLSLKEEEKGDAEVKELALINDYQLYRVIDTKYIRTYKILTNKLKNGRRLVDYNGFTVPFFITSTRRKIELEQSGEKLKYDVKVTLEGDIEEFNFDKEIFQSQIINDIKNIIEKSMKEELEETTKYFQDDIGYDYLGFKDYTHKYHNKTYKKYKDNWDQAFKDAQINYKVEVNIRRIGTSKK